MAVKASATVTITAYRDISNITRYYKLQASSLAIPSKPTANPPSGWSDAEPAYSSGSTNTLYFVDLTVYTDGTWQYSSVSKSSSYEAAKEAYNKAVEAANTADTAKTNAATAQSTANTAKTNAAAAQDTADTALENAAAAAKTATNFLSYDSTNGLLVGNKTSGAWSGYRSQILPTAFNILDASGNILSSFGANKVILGRNNANSEIDLCDGAGTIKAITSGASTSYPHYDSIEISTQDFMTKSQSFTAKTTAEGDTYLNTAETYMLSYKSTDGAYARLKGECKVIASGDIYKTGVSAMALEGTSYARTLIFAEFWDESAGTWAQSNQINVYPNKTTMSKQLIVSGNVSINGITHTGKNKILWSGAYYMTDTQTATLSEAISAQPHGVVFVWSYYKDGAADNSAFNLFFVPKQFVASHNGKGVSMFLITGTMGSAASKYLYVSDTSVKGHSNNNAAAADKTCGITSSPKLFVLRYIIGV